MATMSKIHLEAQEMADQLLRENSHKNAIQLAVMNVTQATSEHKPATKLLWQTTLKILRERL